eukprot:GILI01016732.1.p1 GENE.GILI01016732.1~~GILI01016732.1.p1  ORF type:complete len:409 (+),score=15.17 GILI01016732.1:40-1227(+)
MFDKKRVVLFVTNSAEYSSSEVPQPLIGKIIGGDTSSVLTQLNAEVQSHVSGNVIIEAIIVAWEDKKPLGDEVIKCPLQQRVNRALAASENAYLQSKIYSVISKFSSCEGGSCLSIFTVVLSHEYTVSPYLRELSIDGFRFKMVTNQLSVVRDQLIITASTSGTGSLSCPVCFKDYLTSDELWYHVPQLHTTESGDESGNELQQKCPICTKSFRNVRGFSEHLFHDHPPKGLTLPPHRPDVQLYSFALMVIRRPSDNKFLLVQERSRRGWWLPGGGIDSAEDPIAGGVRETLEEAGVRVTIKGLLSIRVNPSEQFTRLWYIFYGEPEDISDCEAKTAPDHESVGGCWATLEDVTSGSLRLRGSEPLEWFPYVANGGTIHPMSLLDVFGAKKKLKS